MRDLNAATCTRLKPIEKTLTLKTNHETHAHVPLCLAELIARMPPLSVTDRGRPK